MATADQITEVRQNTDTVADVVEYDDEYLGGLVDTYSIAGASARVWQNKAAKFAKLVDVTEGSSSRKMSQLHDHAMEMAGHFYALAGETSSRTKVHKIVRS